MTVDIPVGTAAFWSALEEGRFLIGQCSECTETYFPPSAVCPYCAGDGGTVESDGEGIVYSFTRLHRTAPGFDQPLVMGLVELDEGPRLLARFAAEFDDLAIGTRVHLRVIEYDGPYDRGRLAGRPFFEAVP